MNPSPDEKIQIFTGCAKTHALHFVLSLKPCIPLSRERPCTIPTNQEVMRWMKQKAVRINGNLVQPNDLVDLPVTSLQFFPNSKKHRTTIF